MADQVDPVYRQQIYFTYQCVKCRAEWNLMGHLDKFYALKGVCQNSGSSGIREMKCGGQLLLIMIENNGWKYLLEARPHGRY